MNFIRGFISLVHERLSSKPSTPEDEQLEQEYNAYYSNLENVKRDREVTSQYLKIAKKTW